MSREGKTCVTPDLVSGSISGATLGTTGEVSAQCKDHHHHEKLKRENGENKRTKRINNTVHNIKDNEVADSANAE